MNEILIKRVKSLAWRAGAMAVIAVGAYVLQIGDIFKLDPHVLINLGALAAIGLIVAEVTKALNS